MASFFERRVLGLSRYDDDDSRVRAKVLGSVSLGLVAVSAALSFLVEQPVHRGIVAGLGASNLLVYLLLRFGALRVAVLATVLGLSLLTNAIVFLQAYEVNEVYMAGAFNLFVVLVASLIARSDIPVQLATGGGILALVLHLVLRRLPNEPGAGMPAISDLIICSFAVGMGGLIVTSVARRSRKLLARSEEVRAYDRQRAATYKEALAETRRSLDSGAGLTESAERTERLVREILERNEAVRERLEALQSEARRVEAASSAMSGAASGTSDAVNDQVAVVEQTSAAVVEMTASIEAISRIAQERREAIQALAEGAAKGAEAIARVTEAMAGLRGRVASTGEIVKVIKKVASQTGLLAMNASIEAAHAGEAGGGFAVVATEIRNLADETARNAKIIAETLGAVAGSIVQAGATNAEASLAYEGVRAEIEKVAAAIAEIAQGVSELSAGTDEINRGTQQSVASSQSVRESVSTVSSRVAEVEAGLRSQESAAKAIAASLEEMAERLSGLGEEAARVREAGLANQSALAGLGRKLEGLGSES